MKTLDPVTRYAAAVHAGGEVVSGLVRLACERHLQDLETGAERGLVWKADEAQRAIDFFAEVLVLPENTDAGEVLDENASSDPRPFVLAPWQEFIVGSLFGWYTTAGFRRFREAYIETAKGSGKALALDTPIPTPGGWTTMGALRVGDEVFDERGRITNVIGAYDTMAGHDCYEVVFDDGSTIVADAEHLWFTEQRQSARSDGRIGSAGVPMSGRGRWRRGIRTTEEIRRTLRYANGAYQSANHSVPLAGPLGTEAKPLPVPPYVLGAWLGDGDSDCARLTVSDQDAELLEHVAACGVSVGDRRQTMNPWPRAPRYRIGSTGGRGNAAPNSLNAVLRRMGLLNTQKHIPADYLRGSVDQRLALLQGLMDTDGYISPTTGACEFCSTDEPLAIGVRELVVSLGMKCTVRESAAKLYGREVSRRWRLQFCPPHDLPVFRLRRKAKHQVQRHARRRLAGDRRIVDVRPVSSVPVRCIAVDSPSRLFLAGRSMIPTHNTPLGAGIMLYLLIADGERGAQVFLAAVTREQAGLAWNDVKAIVKASPELRDVFDDTQLLANELKVPGDTSFLKPVSSEKRGLDGKRVHGALVDELHEHATPVVVNKMRAGTKGRRNALIVKTTNSGFDRTSVCWHHHEQSRQVLTGAVRNDAWFAFVCGLDPCEACLAKGLLFPSDECKACDRWDVEGPHWKKANPNLGVSLPWQYVRERVNQARVMASEVSDVLRFNFCVWTTALSRFFDMAKWAACKETVSEDDLLGVPCYGGVDLGQTDDLSAFARVWVLPDGRWVAKLRYWLPRAALEKYPNRPYDEWKRSGLLTITDGDTTDDDRIEDEVLDLCRDSGVVELSYDKRFAHTLALHWEGAGLTCIDTPQGFALNEAIRKVSTLVAEGALCHGGDPILSVMAANAVVREGRNREIRLDKEKSAEKIDGISALVNAASRAMVHVNVEPPEVIGEWAEW